MSLKHSCQPYAGAQQTQYGSLSRPLWSLNKIAFTLLPVFAGTVSYLAWQHFNRELSSSVEYVCRNNYTAEIMSADPLVVYLDNFLSDFEVDSLLVLSRSYNYTYPDKYLSEAHRLRARTSSYIVLPTQTSPSSIQDEFQPVTQCITTRAKAFAGNLYFQDLEDLQIVRYLLHERHDFHVDWHFDPDTEDGREGTICNRRFSYFVYLDAPPLNGGGGETYFPDVQAAPPTADGAKFARTSRNERGEPGLLVRPKRGSAIFWVNLDHEGRGDNRVLHAGMPVTNGTKVGMNILGEWCGKDPDDMNGTQDE